MINPFSPPSDPHLLLSAYDLNTGLHLHHCLILSCSLAPFPGRLSGPQTPSPSTQTPPGSVPLSLPVGVIHSPPCVWCLLRSAELGIICSQPPQPSTAAKGEPAQSRQDSRISPRSLSHVHSGGPPGWASDIRKMLWTLKGRGFIRLNTRGGS